MLNSNNKMSGFKPNNLKPKDGSKDNLAPRVSLGVHSMPKTSEKSFKSWFLLGGFILIIIIALFLLLVV
ncbi:MAG TPA: hypothetical protein VFD51_01475 [Patescibacteria group bacterium]|nr:hypothetical protein [Patescibacteria group bacterium]